MKYNILVKQVYLCRFAGEQELLTIKVVKDNNVTHNYGTEPINIFMKRIIYLYGEVNKLGLIRRYKNPRKKC